MVNKENFRKFIASRPELASYVNSGNMTWQKFYEMYDLYGEDSTVWNDYRNKQDVNSNSSINKINDLIKNVDVNSIKDHISTAQKALDFVQELTSKGTSASPKAVPMPRPLNKFFED